MGQSPHIKTYKSFACTFEDMKSQLEHTGIAVIPLFSSEECKSLRQRAWSDLTRLIGLTESDPSTYQSLESLYPLRSMLINRVPLSYLQWVWDIRQDPRVAEVFASIWGVPKEDLLVSFDAISIHMPPEVTGQGWYEDNPWIHVDQSSQKPNLCSVQGFVNLYPVNPGDATLFVLEGSHKYFNEYFQSKNIDTHGDFYIFDEEEVKFFVDRGCEPRRVLANEGDLVLWDSRVCHMGSEPIKGRKRQNFRIVVYVCMMPRATATREVIEKRLKAFELRRLTSHWANNPQYGGEFPEGFYPFELEDIGVPTLTELGRRLAGFE